MNLLDRHTFFFELPLYTPIKIDRDNLDAFFSLMNDKALIDAYNPTLKQETTYQIIRLPNYSVSPAQFYKIRVYEDIKEFQLQCVRNGFTITIFARVNKITRQNGENELVEYNYMKVGQYPSIADLHISKIKEYDKVLPKNKLKEITKAIGLAANGVGIGSFVYLRRVFEYLIDEAYNYAKLDTEWSETEYQKSRMAEKIDLLKNHLPNFLVENRNMYSILSLGIHELQENECLAHFEALKVGIEFILDEKVEQLIKKQKIEEAKKKLQNISQQVAKK